MQKSLMALLLLLVFALIAGCCPMKHRGMAGCENCPKMKAQGQPCCVVASGAAMDGQTGQQMRPDVVYVCDCGGGCTCNSISETPGACACGKPMRWHHVLKVEGDEALLCGCAEGCQCKIDPNNPNLCGCGEPVKRINLKGSGLYFCNCGGSCACNTLSNAPGDCRCGMKLKQAN